MALEKTYITRETLWPFHFHSPRDFPHVLVLFCHEEAVWSMSSSVKRTPMSGIEIETKPGNIVEPDISNVLQVGYSQWYLSANDSANTGVQIFSVLFSGANEDAPDTFDHVFDIEDRTMRTPYAVDADPDHLPKLPKIIEPSKTKKRPKKSCSCNSSQCAPCVSNGWSKQGELVCSGTNFVLVPYYNDCTAAALLACIDTTNRCRPAWIIDHDAQTLYFPDYATNRAVNRRFRAPTNNWWHHISGWQLTLLVLLLIGLILLALYIIPVTRYLLWEIGIGVVDATSHVINVEGYPPPPLHHHVQTVVSAVQRLPYYYGHPLPLAGPPNPAMF